MLKDLGFSLEKISAHFCKFTLHLQMLSCVYLVGGFIHWHHNEWSTRKETVGALLLLITNVSLLMIDNIHFQYNGILSALLLFSLGLALRRYFLPVRFFHIFDFSLDDDLETKGMITCWHLAL